MNEDQANREFFEHLVSYEAKMLDHSAAYNQVVVLAGYAAFFGVWSAISAKLPEWVAMTCAALIIVSVFTYVLWTVINMVHLNLFNRNMVAALSQGVDGYMDRVRAVEAGRLPSVNKIMKWWKPVLILAGSTAAMSAILLSVAAMAETFSYSLGCR
jgi:hypothetical protein